MIILRLAASLAALVWGGALCARRKQPLFFKILLFAAASYFLGALFEGCWLLVYGAVPEGFHVGYLGCVGMWFFLFSSYFGAIDRLADGGERMYRPYRLTALLAPLAVLGLTIWSVTLWGAAASLPLLLLVIPMGATLFFALKHLLLPDVETGIIRVMRPYNALAPPAWAVSDSHADARCLRHGDAGIHAADKSAGGGHAAHGGKRCTKMVYVIFLCIALPLGLMLPILERRSRRLVFFLLLGMVSALVAYKLNSLLYPLSGLDVVQFSQTVPPVTEEFFKALPILVFAVFFSDDRRDILPAAMSVGIGFSVLENTTLLVQNTLTATLYLPPCEG